MKVFLLLIITISVSGLLHAQESSGVLSTPGRVGRGSHWIAGYEGEYVGSSFQRASNDNPQNLESTLLLGWQLNKTWMIGVNGMADSQPVDGGEWRWKDPFLQVKAKKLFQTERFVTGGDLRVYLPATQKSMGRDLRAGLRVGPTLAFVLGDSWKLGAKTMFRYNLYGDSPALDKKKRKPVREDFTAFLKPYITYQMTSRLAFELLYELEGSHQERQNFSDWNRKSACLQPGLEWDVLASLNLRPYLGISTAQALSLASTFVGLDLKWTLN